MALDGAVVEVTSLSSAGDGVARLEDGRVVFVAGGVPGDRVALEITEERKRFVKAEIARILEPGPGRTQPQCAHFGECGGCLWQHVEYDVQLAAKRKSVKDALERIGGVTLEDEIEIVPSPSPYGYRGRARLVECERGVGYRVRGGEGARAVRACPVLVSSAEAVLVARGEAVREAKGPSGRRVREWVVTTGSDGTSIVTPAGTRKKARSEAGAAKRVSIEVAGSRLWVSGDSFVQGNVLLWEALTLRRPWAGVVVAHQIWVRVQNGERPPLTAADAARAPAGYAALVRELWHQDPVARPTFAEALRRLRAMRAALPADAAVEAMAGGGGLPSASGGTSGGGDAP